jgi:putative tricarboxylic transport membrane protein
VTGFAERAGLGLIVVAALAATPLALRYQLFDEDGPGSGLFPLTAIALILLFSAIAAFERKPAAGALAVANGVAEEEPGRPTPARLVVFVLVLIAWALLLQPLGHLVASFAAMTALLAVGGVRPLVAAAIGAAATLASHGLFVALLDVPLPAFGWR